LGRLSKELETPNLAMEQSELEQIIEKARIDRSTTLSLSSNQLTKLPDSIGTLSNLTCLKLRDNQLNILPDSIGNLFKLRELDLSENKLDSIPSSINNLFNLKDLNLRANNHLKILPKEIINLVSLQKLDLSYTGLTDLTDEIGNFVNLTGLFINNNQISTLPTSIKKLVKLAGLYLANNPISDLSILQALPRLRFVHFCDVRLLRRYWAKFSDWKAEWLLDEDNAEIRRLLIKKIGYEKVCDELNAITIDNWREYTLLKIDGVEAIYDEDGYDPIDREPMLLLKMTCLSTAHIHILRVPPEMTSAEAAITWVNHGIHPDEFSVQT
jgi:leucine-rich repeat protein SHOC2